jgi:hypothetical protein
MACGLWDGKCGGDSGSPITNPLNLFFPYPENGPVDAALLGINWGVEDVNGDRIADGESFFSSFPSVEADLGKLNTCAHPIEC